MLGDTGNRLHALQLCSECRPVTLWSTRIPMSPCFYKEIYYVLLKMYVMWFTRDVSTMIENCTWHFIERIYFSMLDIYALYITIEISSTISSQEHSFVLPVGLTKNVYTNKEHVIYFFITIKHKYNNRHRANDVPLRNNYIEGNIISRFLFLRHIIPFRWLYLYYLKYYAFSSFPLGHDF